MGNIVHTGAAHAQIREDYMYRYQLPKENSYRLFLAGVVPRGAEVPFSDLTREELIKRVDKIEVFEITKDFLVGMLHALVGWEFHHSPRSPAYPSNTVQYLLWEMSPSASSLLERFNFVYPPPDPVRDNLDRWGATDVFSFWNVIRVKLEPSNDIHNRASDLFERSLEHVVGGRSVFLASKYMLIFYFRTERGTVVRFVRDYTPRAAYRANPNGVGWVDNPEPGPDVKESTDCQQVVVLYRLEPPEDALRLLNHHQGPGHMLLPLRPLGIPAYRPERLAHWPL